jgi:RNA polymerase sigma factor (sigma-70 family)
MEEVDETPAVTEAEGPADSVEAAYRRQSERLWRALLLFGGDAEIASDAVAEAFAQALRRGAAIRDVDRWVWRGAFAIARGELKRRRSSTPDVPDVAAEAPADTVDVIRALAELSPKQRGSIVLHHYAGYTTKETAAILGSTAAAVGVHLERGRKRLRELLGDDDA